MKKEDNPICYEAAEAIHSLYESGHHYENLEEALLLARNCKDRKLDDLKFLKEVLDVLSFDWNFTSIRIKLGLAIACAERLENLNQ